MNNLRYIFIIVLCLLFFIDANAQLPDPEIISVSVDTFPNDGRVTINWNKINHPDLHSYKIYKITEDGLRPEIETIDDISRTSYTHTEAKAKDGSRGYTMVSVAVNGDANNFVDPHYTIFLKDNGFNACEKAIELIWNNYVGWEDEIKSYKIYVKENNGPYELNELKLGFSDTISLIENVNYNSVYKACVFATSNTGVESYSNIIEIITDSESPINSEEFFIDSVVYDGTSVVLKFNVDDLIEISKYDIKTKNTPEDSFEHIVFVESTGAKRYKYIHNGVSDTDQSYYKIEAVGLCDDSLGVTNTVQQVILQGFVSNNIVSFTWNYCFEEYIEEYTIWVDVDQSGFTSLPDELTTRGVQFDLVELSGGNSEYFCFKVTADHPDDYFGESNTLCFALMPEVTMPTAFTPNGEGPKVNETIGPTIKYANITKYQFIVYNRSGGKVFETNRSEMRWDGKAGIKSVTEGAYLYYIKFSTSQGMEYEKSGTINVIYP